MYPYGPSKKLLSETRVGLVKAAGFTCCINLSGDRRPVDNWREGPERQGAITHTVRLIESGGELA
jgi:hypothetical protein